MDAIHFEEKQRFKEIAFYILLGLLQSLFLWGLIQQVIFNKPWGTKPSGDIALIIINIGVFALMLLLYSVNLKTRITEKYISFRMAPFHNFPNSPTAFLSTAADLCLPPYSPS